MLTPAQFQLLMLVLLVFGLSLLAYLLFFPAVRANILVFFRSLGREIASPLLPPPAKLPVPLGNREALHVGWVGHATWLMEFEGVRVLTDPVFSRRVTGNRRMVRPALAPQDIRSLDVILLSHAHFDHLDIPSLKKLPSTAALLHPQGDEDLLKDLYQPKTALSPDQSMVVKGLTITALPVRHQAQRPTRLQKRRSLAYLLEKGGKRVLFAGDTAYSTRLVEKVKELCPDGIDLFLVPIAAYQPEVFHQDHCTPEEALQMGLSMGARQIVPMHYNTFVLSLEPVDEPLQRFQKAAEKLGVGDRIKILPIGGHLSQ